MTETCLNLSDFVRACHFAAVKHKNQRRKCVEDIPYINHPIGKYGFNWCESRLSLLRYYISQELQYKRFDKRKIRSSVTSEYNDQVNWKFRKEKFFSFLHACECHIIGVIFGVRSLDCRILSLGVAYHLVEYGITDAVTLCAAVLHDTVEDTDATFKEIEEHFGAEVERIVREVRCEVARGTSSI